MKDTITINYEVLEKISKGLLSYIEDIEMGDEYLAKAEEYLITQDGSAVAELMLRTITIRAFLKVLTAEAGALKTKIDNATEGLRSFLSPVPPSATVSVRLLSVVQFLEAAKSQVLLAFTQPPINSTNADYSYMVYTSDGVGYLEWDQWRYDNEYLNGDFIYSIQNTDTTIYRDNCFERLAKMQMICDYKITPFFNLDNQLGGEFAEFAELTRSDESHEYENLEQRAYKYVGQLLVFLLFETDAGRAALMTAEIVRYISALGVNPMISGDIKIPFNIGDVQGEFKANAKLKTDDPNAIVDFEASLTDQLGKLKLKIGNDCFLKVKSSGDISLGADVEGVTVVLETSDIRIDQMIKLSYNSKPIDNEFYTIATSIELSKKFPKPKPPAISQPDPVSIEAPQASPDFVVLPDKPNDTWWEKGWGAITPGIEVPPQTVVNGILFAAGFFCVVVVGRRFQQLASLTFVILEDEKYQDRLDEAGLLVPGKDHSV